MLVAVVMLNQRTLVTKFVLGRTVMPQRCRCSGVSYMSSSGTRDGKPRMRAATDCCATVGHALTINRLLTVKKTAYGVTEANKNLPAASVASGVNRMAKTPLLGSKTSGVMLAVDGGIVYGDVITQKATSVPASAMSGSRSAIMAWLCARRRLRVLVCE